MHRGQDQGRGRAGRCQAPGQGEDLGPETLGQGASYPQGGYSGQGREDRGRQAEGDLGGMYASGLRPPSSDRGRAVGRKAGFRKIPPGEDDIGGKEHEDQGGSGAPGRQEGGGGRRGKGASAQPPIGKGAESPYKAGSDAASLRFHSGYYILRS